MSLFKNKDKMTDTDMEGKISRIETYSFGDVNLPRYLKEIKRDLKGFPPEKRDEYTDTITKKAKERGVDFTSI